MSEHFSTVKMATYDGFDMRHKVVEIYERKLPL